MKKRIGKIFYWAACFILTSGIATYAAENRVAVSYSDLNLAHEDGARPRAGVVALEECGLRADVEGLGLDARVRVGMGAGRRLGGVHGMRQKVWGP